MSRRVALVVVIALVFVPFVSSPVYAADSITVPVERGTIIEATGADYPSEAGVRTGYINVGGKESVSVSHALNYRAACHWYDASYKQVLYRTYGATPVEMEVPEGAVYLRIRSSTGLNENNASYSYLVTLIVPEDDTDMKSVGSIVTVLASIFEFFITLFSDLFTTIIMTPVIFLPLAIGLLFLIVWKVPKMVKRLRRT